MTPRFARPMGRAHARALLLASTSLCALPLSAQAQEPKKADLPPVTVTQPQTASPATKKVVAKKKPAQPAAKPASAPTPAPEPVEQADATAPLGAYNPALDIPGLKVPPGVTVTTAGPVDGYRALTAMSATKTATPIEQIPQSIQVVPQKLISDQNALTIDEAVRNTSGTQGANELMTPFAERTVMRGFRAEQWLDGMNNYYNPGDRDAMANVERIEVLKGPNALLYSGGVGAPIGGAVNVISKLPTDRASAEVGVKFGSDSYLRPWFDLNQPIAPDKTVLFRVTGEYKQANSFIEVLDAESYALNPTLTFTNKTDATLTIQGRLSHWEQQDYQGLPATGTVAGGFNIRRDLFIGPADIPKSTSDISSVTATFDRKFNEYVSSTSKVRWSNSSFSEYTQTLVDGAGSFQGNTPVFGTLWGLSNSYLHQDLDELSATSNLIAKFSLGVTNNVMVVGADYSRVHDSGILTTDAFLGGVGLVDLSAANPVFFPYIQPPDSLFTTASKQTNTYVNKGVFAQMQTTLFDTVHLVGGVRWADIEIETIETIPFFGFAQTGTEQRALPHIGAAIDVVKGLTVFADYSESIKGVPGNIYVGPAKPEEGRQTEAGIKFNTSFGLSGSLTVFDIDRTNTAIASGLGIGVVAAGTEHSEGFEADVLWQPTSNLSVLGNFAYVDAEFSKASGTIPAGNKRHGVPDESGRVWVNYAFDAVMLKGWSIGAGVYVASGAWVDDANTFKTSGYYTVDAKVGYDTEHWHAAFNVKNLTGEEYFVPYDFFGGRVAPGSDRTYYGSLSYKY